ILSFDNISVIPEWLSDALCSLSTGSGFRTRKLYKDSEEKIFDPQRPVIFNGIVDFVTRPDLLDRSLILNLPEIKDEKRRQEAELDREFNCAKPRILGGLLDAAVTALRNLPLTKPDKLHRNADFAVFVQAAEEAHSKEPIFLKAY